MSPGSGVSFCFMASAIRSTMLRRKCRGVSDPPRVERQGCRVHSKPSAEASYSCTGTCSRSTCRGSRTSFARETRALAGGVCLAEKSRGARRKLRRRVHLVVGSFSTVSGLRLMELLALASEGRRLRVPADRRARRQRAKGSRNGPCRCASAAACSTPRARAREQHSMTAPARLRRSSICRTRWQRKYPNAGRDWGWQFVFPASRDLVASRAPRSVRWHLHERSRAARVRIAVRRAGIDEAGRVRTRCATASRRTCSSAATTFARSRSSWVTSDVSTTMIYTHVMNGTGAERGRTSPRKPRTEERRSEAPSGSTPPSPTSRDSAAGRCPCPSAPRRDTRGAAAARCRRSARSRDRHAASR